MPYNEKDLLETSSPELCREIAKARELTRRYNQLPHDDDLCSFAQKVIRKRRI